MSDVTLQRLSDRYLDVLMELGNIGSGNAMTALSQMLQCKIDMQVPQVKLLDFSEVGTVMGVEEQIMVCVYLGVEGDVTGSMMFVVELEGARHLIDKVMMGMPTSQGEEFTELELSAMTEVGNIITGAYLNSLSMMTNLKMCSTPPEVAIDMACTILSVPAVQFGILGDKILLIQSKFFDEIELNGYFILIPDIESYGKILSSLGLSVEGIID